MPFVLQDVVPWGRSYDEYVRMFSLTEGDLAGAILGCGDGPASFNAVASRRGVRIVSVDPLYQFDHDQIANRIDATRHEVIAQTRQNVGQFAWKHITSVEELESVRIEAMTTFLDDYEAGRRAGRYLAAELPNLPFVGGRFDLAICSHLLFLYDEHLSLNFHFESLRELCRIARQVRVFPLVSLDGAPSEFVDAVTSQLRQEDFLVDVQRVGYEFQRGANQMLVVTPPKQRSAHVV